MDLATILRKCKILAARLGSEEFAQSITWELDGYPDDQATPPYRRLEAQYYANFIGVGWNADKHPFLWPVLGKEAYEQLHQIEFREGIAKASALIKGARIDRSDLGLLVQGKMFPDMNCVGAWVEIGGNEFAQLLSAVKNRILDFVLQIEAENPDAGEAPPNTHPVPAEKLQPLVQNFFGPVSNVAHNCHGFSQTATVGVSDADLRRLITELSGGLDELQLGVDEKRDAQAQLNTLRAQLTDTPNPVIVREAASAAPSPTWSTPCRTCRPAAWADRCSPGKARRSTPPRRQEVRVVESPGAAGPGRDGPP